MPRGEGSGKAKKNTISAKGKRRVRVQRPKRSKSKQLVAKKLKQLFIYLVKGIAVAAVLAIIVFTCFLTFCLYDLPDIDSLEESRERKFILIYDRVGKVLANYGDADGQNLSYTQMPKNLIEAVIAIEDQRFFKHPGIDFFGIIRAAYANYSAGRVVQGASTITQQLAKIMFLSSERSVKRKVQEAVLAVQLERHLHKEKILSAYLNNAFFGHGAFGVDAASKFYFAKSAKDVNLYEAAVLAAILKAPSRYTAEHGRDDMLRRAQQVMYNMVDAGFISKSDMRSAQPPVFAQRGLAKGALQNPYFTDYVLEIMPSILPAINQSIHVYTTFDMSTQSRLEFAVRKVLEEHAAKLNIEEVAAIVMTKDGEIRAMLGGKSYANSQFNRATNAQRQPGSLFKLFVYAAALEEGVGLKEIISDKEIRIANWQPKNYPPVYRGYVTIAEAFAKSINTSTVLLSERVGRGKVIKMAHRLGIVSTIRNTPSVTLGTSEANLLELTRAYAIFANNGRAVKARSVLQIKNAKKKVIYTAKNGLWDRSTLIAPEHVRNMRFLLRSVVQNGTGKRAAIPGEDVFGKTGTSQNFRDAWFIGFADDLVLGIWVGNEKGQMKKVTGGKIPAIIFREFFSAPKDVGRLKI